MKKSVLIPITVGLAIAFAMAQDQGEGPRRMPGEGIAGKVTAISKDSVTITPMRGGDPVTIKVGDDTRVMKERQPAKLSDIKVGDTVMARGQLAGNVLQAQMLGVVSPEMLQRLQQGGMGFAMGNGAGGGQFKPEDWGKTFIAGRIKAINETTLTITRAEDSQSLNIEVDEDTSFKKGRESITLADIKADDFVFGPGELKNGVFVAKELRVGGGRMFMVQPGSAPDANKAESEKPAIPPKN